MSGSQSRVTAGENRSGGRTGQGAVFQAAAGNLWPRVIWDSFVSIRMLPAVQIVLSFCLISSF